MDLQDKVLNSFSRRANVYSQKTNWVNFGECIAPLVPDVFGNGIALDACAGTGAITKALVDRGWNEVFSLDISPDMLKVGKLRFPIIGDIHNIPFLDNYFDLVVCRQGLQYSNLERAIGELVRVSKKKILLGHITKAVGDMYAFWEDYFRIASPGRKHIFTPGQIQETANSMNLKTRLIATVTQKDNYIGPIIHLNKEEQRKLVSLLLDTPDSFKKLYNVVIENDAIFYDNNWEFIEIEL